jgi:hypothetical protein
MHESYRIFVETLENGFKVEVPDLEMVAKKKAAAKKAGPKGDMPAPYIGDCTKSFAAKSVKEVLALVRGALEKIPGNEFDAAWEEATGKY